MTFLLDGEVQYRDREVPLLVLARFTAQLKDVNSMAFTVQLIFGLGPSASSQTVHWVHLNTYAAYYVVLQMKKVPKETY